MTNTEYKDQFNTIIDIIKKYYYNTKLTQRKNYLTFILVS